MSGQYLARLRMTSAVVPKNVPEPKALPPKSDDYIGLVENRERALKPPIHQSLYVLICSLDQGYVFLVRLFQFVEQAAATGFVALVGSAEVKSDTTRVFVKTVQDFVIPLAIYSN